MELKFPPNSLSMKNQSRPDLSLENFQSMQAERLSRSESKDVYMELKTKEGDIVTLSKSSDFESELSTYSAFNKDRSGYTKEEGLYSSLEFSSSFEISVEGDLNKEELKDLNKAIRKLDKTMEKIAEGDLGKALHKAMSIGNLNSVAGFEANFSYLAKEEYSQIQESAYETASKAVNEPPKLDDTTKELLTEQTDEVAEKAKETKVPKEKVFDSIKEMFKNMKEKMEKAHPKKSENPWENFLNQLQDRFEEDLFMPPANGESVEA